MSDTAYYENQYDAAPRSGRWKSMFGGLAAAVLSLTMLGAVVAWAYQISVRDAYDVPVVRAIEGPMKQRPEKTGGLTLEETDLAVDRMVSGDAGSGEVALAPAGEGLAPEDKPVETLRRETSAPPQLKPKSAGDEAVSVATAPDAAPAAPVVATPEAAIGSSTGTPVAALQGDVTPQAPDQSPVAQLRPKTLDTTPSPAPASDAASDAAAPAPSTPAPRQIAAIGEPVVQLGAFTSRQLAERVWKDQKVINRRLFRGMEASITPVQSGGRELYRLRVGPFASADEAKKVCVVLKARGSDCIVTRSE